MSDQINILAPTKLGEIVIRQQFQGPPGCGNGGYVCGAIARALNASAPTTVILRAPAPLEVPLMLWGEEGGVRLADAEGATIGLAKLALPDEIAVAPPPPTYEAAVRALYWTQGQESPFHRDCFCRRSPPGSGLQAYTGQLEDRPVGEVAGAWTPHVNFADDDGLISVGAVWGALDCPGSFAWVVTEGGQGGALGTMTCEIRRRPAPGEPCIITAWREGAKGRKRLSGTALYSASGEFLGASRQVWIFPTAI